MATHEQCPKCADLGKDTSKDNFAVYADGHGHCYACGYHQHPRGFWTPAETTVAASPVHSIVLPEDASVAIDAQALAWLSKYEIEMKEVVDNKMMWSDMQKFLIFPIYADSESPKLLGWQARTFDPKAKSRYYNVGPFHEFFHTINLFDGAGDDVIIVEDLISAIKVGRRYSTIPLFGNHLTLSQMRKLNNFSERLTFWLDEDKMDKSMELAKRATQLGFSVRVVVTKHDPKVYTDEEIRQTLEA